MIDDAELLRRYVADRSQSAFAELVHRRVNLVYSVALRQVGGDAHLAEDVTQKVFADLARKAPSLTDRAVLSGWLYRSAQFAASDVVRAERRRRVREQTSSLMHEITSEPGSAMDWDRIRPLLDEAMGELREDDRDAIALRFFEGRAFAEVGRTLQLTEEAARKRVERALDKLAAVLARRGVTSTSAAVGAVLAQQVAVAAPAGLAAAVTGAACAGAGAAAGAAGLAAFLNPFGLALGTGAVAAVAIGVAVYEAGVARRQAGEMAALTQAHRATVATLAEVQQRLAQAEQHRRAAEEDNTRLLAAIQQQSAARTAAAAPGDGAARTEAEPLTHDAVQARYRRAQELARTGDPAEALRELLWCFDTGMPPITGFGGVRLSFLLSNIATLGQKYPPALAALRERRDRAERRLRLSETDHDATSTFSAINNYLKENARTIAVFDQLPPDDRRRASLALVAFEDLLQLRRYADAALGRSHSQMTQQFERNIEERSLPPGIANPAALRKVQRDYAVTTAAKHVEVLAGVGSLEQARSLAAKVLAFDASAATTDLLQRHAERAGQANLLTGLR